jgi:hypothetical protein
MTDEIIEMMREELPKVFPGPKLDELTGGAISWGTTQNRRSRGEIPDENAIFFRAANRILVRRDPFLDWWATTLSEARRPPIVPPGRGRREDRAGAIPAADDANAAHLGPDPAAPSAPAEPGVPAGRPAAAGKGSAAMARSRGRRRTSDAANDVATGW